MPFCGKCGTPLGDTAKFCPSCGTPVATTSQQTQQQSFSQRFTEKAQKLNDTPDTTVEFDTQDIEKNRIMSLFAYLDVLVLIPLFGAKDSKFARFHANQGLVLMIAFALFSFLKLGLRAMLMIILPDALAKIIMAVIGIFSLVFPILKIVGIVNAASGKAKELPIIGSIRILK